jgi:hypothetical protein
MGYWVYGNDRETGERARFYSDARDEDGARSQAREQGLFVERLVMGKEEPRREPEPRWEPEPEVHWEPEGPPDRNVYAPPEPLATLSDRTSSPPAYLTFSGVALVFAELVAVISSGGSLFALAFVLAAMWNNPGQTLLYAVACLLSFFYNAGLAVVFSYVRQQLKLQREEA